MSQTIMIHNVASVVKVRKYFPKDNGKDGHQGFFKLEFLVTDTNGNAISINLFSDTETEIEVKS